MEITTESTKTTIGDLTYYKTFVNGEYIGYGWTEQDAYDFGIRYAKTEGLNHE